VDGDRQTADLTCRAFDAGRLSNGSETLTSAAMALHWSYHLPMKWLAFTRHWSGPPTDARCRGVTHQQAMNATST